MFLSFISWKKSFWKCFQLLKLDVVRVIGVNNVLYHGFNLHVMGLIFMTAAILPSHDCCFNFQVKVRWILIGCQCYYRYHLENCSESNSNNINILCHYVVDFAILIELEQFIKMYSYCYSYCPCEQAFIQRFILHWVGCPHDCHHFAITLPPVQGSYVSLCTNAHYAHNWVDKLFIQ